MNCRYREKESPSNRKQADYAVEVIKIKFNINVVLKVQKQSFVDVRRRKTPVLQSCNKVAKHRCFPVNFVKFLMIFFLQTTSIGCFWKFERCLCSRIFVLSLCFHLIYFHSYSFAPSMAKVSSNMVFSNVSLNDAGYRKKCIVRERSWNSEKSSSHSEVFC